MTEFLERTIDIEGFLRSVTQLHDIAGGFKYALLIVPFILVITGGWLTGAVPDRSAVGRVLSLMAEADLSSLLKKNGFAKTGVALYQAFRILSGVLLSVGIGYILGLSGIGGAAVFVLLILFFYKFFYVYLVFKDNARIRKLNMVLPYMIKSIAYLSCVYPVNNALIKAIDMAPKEFREDLSELCRDIDDDPVTFHPYQNFIDRYGGRLNRLDYYLKTLYRMSMSASEEETKLLSNLNETISEEMSAARQAKNNAVNSRVTWLGLIPVGLLTIMLLFLMVVISTSI